MPYILNFICCITFSCLFGIYNIYAQNLPNRQDYSLLAPPNIKVDGKINEWNGLRAYNHATDIFYSMANDKDYLYLAIKSTDPDITNKVYAGGILLTLSASDSDPVIIGYPVFETGDQFHVNIKSRPIIDPTSAKSISSADSFANASNSLLVKKAKWIIVKGISGITDTLISVYNEYGIKIASAFDTEMNYNVEMAIPLRFLKLSGANKLTYDIKLNPIRGNNLDNISRSYEKLPNGRTVTHIVLSEPLDVSNSGQMAHLRSYTSATNFKGSYTLAK